MQVRHTQYSLNKLSKLTTHYMTTKNAINLDKPIIKPKKSYRVQGTDKQKTAVRKIFENIGTGKSVGSALLESNYSEAISKNPLLVTQSKGFQQELRPVVERMIEERDRAIKLMSKKIGKAKYRDMIESVDKLTKNIQLLTGNSTINADLRFSWGSEQEALDGNKEA